MIIDIVGLVATFAVELVRAVRTAALNRELQSKVYLDEATGLPNKNKCEEILGQERPVSAEAPVAVCVFDLNNLHTVNNNFGHEKGDDTSVLLPSSWGAWRPRPALWAATAAMSLSRCCGMPIELLWSPVSLGFVRT